MYLETQDRIEGGKIKVAVPLSQQVPIDAGNERMEEMSSAKEILCDDASKMRCCMFCAVMRTTQVGRLWHSMRGVEAV